MQAQLRSRFKAFRIRSVLHVLVDFAVNLLMTRKIDISLSSAVTFRPGLGIKHCVVLAVFCRPGLGIL